jgi:secreted Zn-dependent insulinase-like peptidase
MHTFAFDNEELQNALKDELTFSKFIEMKERWLKNIRTEWLIMGHLEEKDAINMVKRSESQLKSKTID